MVQPPNRRIATEQYVADNTIQPGDGAGGALSGNYPNPGLNASSVESIVTASAAVRAAYGRSPAYNLDGQLRLTRAALARAAAGIGRAKFATIGDSTVAGFGATPLRSWPLALRDVLSIRGYPSGGTGLVPVNSQVADSRWTIGAGWSPFAGVQSSAYGASQQTALTFTSDQAGDAVVIYYSNYGAGFTYTIDGGAPATVNTNAAWDVATVVVTGLSNAVHTVSITPTAAGGGSFIYGIEVRKGTTGLSVYNAGIAGLKAADVDYGDFFKLPATVAAWDPDLILLGIGTNDATGGGGTPTPVATFKTQMQSVINRVGAGRADILLLAPFPANSQAVATGLGAYITALRELADTNDLPLFDPHERLGTWEEADAAGFMTDAAHPTAAGYRDAATALAAAVAG